MSSALSVEWWSIFGNCCMCIKCTIQACGFLSDGGDSRSSGSQSTHTANSNSAAMTPEALLLFLAVASVVIAIALLTMG